MNVPKIFIELGQNIALLLSLVFIYSLIRPYLKRFSSWVQILTMGILFGLIGIIGMLIPIQISPGVIIDARVVVVALVGLFGGLESALIASGVVGVYRLYLGGIGTLPGLGAIFTGAVIGVWGHRRWSKQAYYFRGWEFLLLGIILAIQGLLWTFLLPFEIAWQAFKLFAIPVLVFYPLGTFFLGMIFSHEMRRYESEEALNKSEKRFRTLMENVPVGVFRAIPEPTGKIVMANSAFLNMFGLDAEEAFKKISMIDLYTDSNQGKVFLDKLITQDNITRIELPLRKRDNTPFWGSLTIRTTRGKSEEQAYFDGIVEDITERKKAEQALKENEENLRITLNSIGDAVIATNIDGNITRMNPVAENLTGWSLEDAAGKPLKNVFQIIHKQTRRSVQNPVEKVLKARKIVGLANHSVLIAKDGTEYQIADSGAPIQDEKGNLIGVVLVFRDVTEQIRTEQELLKVKKLESVGVLAGGIAHDFNNLLTGLFGNIDLAKMLLSPDHKSYKYLESAGHSMERATHLTKQLLTFAKGGDPIKETLSIGEVITETAQFSLRGSNIKLQTNINPDLWLVEADKGQLSQVISNLVINGQQAMPTGGTLTIAAENVETSESRYVKITVQDEGIGIAPQHLDKIFDLYFSTKQKGSGLGLASTLSIISKHNGLITVDSHLNQGTIFTIHLPAAEETEETITEKSLDETDTAPVFPAHILVLDDDEEVREAIRAMLEWIGYKISYATDGQEAIEKYRTSYENNVPFDVVIADLTIPGGMGGQEAAQEILKINSQAKIVVSSGYATDPVLANYEAYGFKARITKPYLAAELQNVIQQVLIT